MTDTVVAPHATTTTDRVLDVAILGNLGESWWSTEWEYSDAWSRNGHLVYGYLEQDPARWDDLICDIADDQFDVVQWTSTRDFRDRAGAARQWELAAACRRTGTPLIGVHLDRWEGLEREHLVHADPYFRAVDVMFTADGDADELWEREGVNHRWLLPAVNERYCYLAEPDPAKYDCDVVFVGGWDNYGHKAWRHRGEMIEHLVKWYGNRFLALPRRGQPRIVGDELNVIYATAKVVVGDSCLVPHSSGRPKRSYSSDRIPESLARGGVLVHPIVDGIHWDHGGSFDYFGWPLGDWKECRTQIDYVLDMDVDDRVDESLAFIEGIKKSHTYSERVRTVIEILTNEGLL